MMTLKFVLIIGAVFMTSNAKADDGLKWSELRLFTTATTLNTAPTGITNMNTADNVPGIDTVRSIGLEADAKWKMLKFGTQIRGMLFSQNPPNATFPSNAYTTYSQYAAGILARLPLLDKDNVAFDIFAEVGAANTKIDIQQSNGTKGTFSKDTGLYERAGVSVALGWPTFKVYLEGGQEWNKINDLTYTGNIATTVSSLDLTGPFVAFGVIIYGIPSWIKPGGVTVGSN